MVTQTYLLDELKDKSLTLQIEKGYSRVKFFYNEELLQEIQNALPQLRKGISWNTSDGHEIYIQMRTGNKSYLHVELDKIPIPASHHYPAKRIKRASVWVLVFGLIMTFFTIMLAIYIPLSLNYPFIYFSGGVGLILIACFWGIRKFFTIALWTPLILFSLNILLNITSFGDLAPIAKLLVILEIIAVISLIRIVKPMRHMQRIKKRLRSKNDDQLIDSFLS